ncbi:disulfide oxidoreductase [Alkalihalophilus lindianensis]|uniref:Probable disulfide formation protein n=1 Tax=Alkalihalophilus lindianensis TaxID=1630542 RepID=A0ABU3X7B6_9BACI|nr:disulfide oxidoreductase [Alkalihalophilus lindianensis]MDV2683339.1 disulfide oxidoreductase [Alkalihalophilus lindianensis]
MNKKVENTLLIAWLMSFTAMLGSLYFSVIRQYEPCTLCWYQRMLMYPLVIILLIGIIKKDASVALYSLLFSIIGLLLSSYHYANQKLSFFAEVAPSCGRVPCTGQYINWLGFITIPFLAFTAFLIIAILSYITLRMTKERKE